ncbi:hypothetical protein LTR22_021020 [Elasticomyces elasticus]|nr:hypothetical protein LTR22_021020 [Elasticomyces elasticus]KAK4914117.1 hypothetical protein LTR49_017628 [Elasticomyces elasticus]
MADSSRSSQSRTDAFLRSSSVVQNRKLWGPAKWVVQLVQYLIAIIIVTIAEGFKAIVSGKNPHQHRNHQAHMNRKSA